MNRDLATGTTLSHYRIISKVGAGGMGEVYLAQDMELDRRVAIKILPESLGSDQQRLQRFIQEAKAASALNHPHILTIHEIGTIGDSRFIATEFIDGETLRQRVAGGMKLVEMLEISSQIAGALAAAHAAGIVHRDVKPENIMVRRDGYSKLLDFGLAKLTDHKATDTEAPTKAMVHTDAGTVMGTSSYMSPEQAKGIDVDLRTDLWSLGVVLYEMVTGHLPFAGETPTETISLILQKEPAPATRFAHDVPQELERIIIKALTKDREERYQTAKDFFIDLRNLKRKLEVDAELDRTVPPELRAAGSTAPGQSPSTVSGAATASGRASSVEYIVSSARQHKLAVVLAVLLLTVGAVALGVYLRGRNTESSIESIAVLPLENQNGDASIDYISDGLTDSIINSLAQLPNLKVIARSSVFRYKGKQSDPLTVARELGVRTVLTGRLLQRGDNLVISTELIDVRDNKQIWGEQYERKVSDLLVVQRDIARQIAGKLRLKLSGAEQDQLSKHYTDNPEAYQLFLQGRFYWNKRTADALHKSVDYFTQAIERDPKFALAHVGLADSWFTMGWYRFDNPQSAYPKSKAAVTRSLELDPDLAEAHAALALIKGQYELDWAGADKEFKLALELNPNYATAYHRYSLFLVAMGRMDEAVAEARKAKEIDPLSLIVNENVGDMLRLARRYDEAEQQLLKTLELDPTFKTAHNTLARLYEAKGMYEKSLDEDFYGAPPEVVADVKKLYAASGMKGVWAERLARLQKRASTEYISQFSLAGLHTLLDDKDKAFECLNKALDERSIQFTYLIGDQKYDTLRSDPRYADLLRRAGLAR